jgi:hypothetical protein
MKRTAAIVAGLVLMAAGIEGLAQETQSAQKEQARIQQMAKDTICEQANSNGRGQQEGKRVEKGKKAGPNDGSGNQGNRPKDGTGYGSNSGKKKGPQDGTGERPGGRNKGGKGRRGGRN